MTTCSTIAILFALFFQSAALGQGFTFRDAGFVGGTAAGGGTGGGGGSPGGGGGGGEGDQPPEPTEWWTMDEASGNRVGSVSGIVMAPTGSAASGTGLLGNALEFPGESSGRLEADPIAASLAYTAGQDLSFSYWVKLTDAIGDRMPAFKFWIRDPPTSKATVEAYSWSGPTRYIDAFVVSGSVYGFYEQDPYSPAQDTWYHWVILYDATTHLLSFYENGALIGSSTDEVTLPSGPNNILRFDRETSSTPGLIDEFGVWIGHKLTAGQITWLNNSGAGRTHPFP
jgi:hypothetical protein